MAPGRMPRRPPEHDLETLSRHKFEGLMYQQKWLVRNLDTTAEYGIDQEVEIFEAGEATGLSFRVQAKGAGKADKTGPYRDIKLEKFEYWASLDSPVLLVLWVESTDTLYGRWVHSYDFGPKPIGEKNHRVRFTEHDKLTAPRVRSLQDEVEVFRLLDREGVPRPIPLALTVEPKDLQPAFTYWFNQYLARNGLRPYVRLTGEHASTWVARVREDSLRVEQPSNSGSLTNWIRNYSTTAPDDLAASDILISLGVLISTLGATSDAVRLFRAADLGALVLNVQETAIRFASIAAHEGATDLLVSKVLQLLPHFEEREVGDVFEVFWFSLLQNAEAMTKDEVKAVRKQAKQTIKNAEHAGLQHDAARLANNVATLMAGPAWPRVEEFLDTAARLDPAAYGTRAEIFLRRGNARWHLGDFPEAFEAYNSARDAGLRQSEIVPPLSDVLFELGRYREAADLLDGWCESEKDIDPRSILRRIILEEVIGGLGLEAQDRQYNPVLASELKGCDDEIVRQAQITSDALDLDLWFLRSDADAPLIGKWALYAFRLGSPQAWIVTLMLAKFGGTDERFTSILIDGAIEAVELVEPAYELQRLIPVDELHDFLDELVSRAFDNDRVAVASRRINFVDSANQITCTFIFDEDGDIIDVEGLELSDEDDEGEIERSVRLQ